MILQYLFFVKNKGSNSVVCAREGGANTTSFQAAHFALQNTKNCGEKRNDESEGGQKFLPPNPLPFCPPEPKRSPAACSVKSRSQQKSFLFLLEEKNRRAQIKKCKENFFAGWRALASGGGANQPFRSKKVRAKCKISPPIETSSFERIAPRGREAAALRKMVRRFAANWLAGQKLKTADLFVSYLKTI